jgi:hypothetical protein
MTAIPETTADAPPGRRKANLRRENDDECQDSVLMRLLPRRRLHLWLPRERDGRLPVLAGVPLQPMPVRFLPEREETVR